MNIFRFFEGRVEAALRSLEEEGVLPSGLDLTRVAVEPPRDPSHGDLSTNAAMVLAKPAGMKPRELAEQLAVKLGGEEAVTEVDVAGPGFINLRLNPAFWQARIPEILRSGPAYGASDVGAGEAVNVEYVSANPTGPMHVGHVRGAVFGDALCNLLEKVGYRVCREYYINDAGGQIEVLARSAFLRYREALGEDIGQIPEGLYPGGYLKPVGQALVAAHGRSLLEKDEPEALSIVREAAVEAMMELIRGDLGVLGIVHETFFSELALHRSGFVEQTLKVLEDKGLIYIGELEPPKGEVPDDWEARPQTLFRSTEFGDDTDRALKKSDGSWTYFAPDIAYHLDKYNRGYRTLIDVWGADHSGYIKRMRAAIAGVTDGNAEFDVKICQLVRLFRNGEPVKMSKRSGDFVTLREVVDEVGKDVVRFMMLTRKNDAPLDFDFAKVMEQSRDNPVFYVQYANARIHSVLRNVAEEGTYDLSDGALANADFTLLTDEAEMALVRLMAGFPRLVEQAALAHEPHRIAFYLDDLAAAFHGLWNKGKDDHSLRFIRADHRDVTLARLALIRSAAYVIAAGLAILGVEPTEEMR
ncbi:arginyl-tRNA synthetase [Parvibaculum lavamentivorans DS-1]|uniref:Arginine--tRNA ligase n=1 Tax=Parvibaculum lavamentivorans (strain DS-1 / DSM 13023 / NCIMB 13966) TaxID=402881 RepID=SYR_PARL1|nr:arginine--tRNA ligase [Parvibaculum lavamentivorans]A7HXJ6.1 RecName: Full=Arginine--tRNA ligase; AltName: Full=Arginyl-tRNA synthetase; Short=ArgRS [Parvibaculum lavamentivorans DS-1]ABS64629.1 arginyl-tRNA synthetase [Parvibaculum lavamentivorans DS-1]